MNWPRIILDGLSMSLLFNAVVGLGFLLVPQAYSTMFPKEIKEAAAPYVERKDVRVMHWIIYPLYLVLVLYWETLHQRRGALQGLGAKRVAAQARDPGAFPRMAADLLPGSRSVCGCDRADPVSMENQPGSFMDQAALLK